MLAGGGYDLGLLLDGDADRAGAADERGTFIHQLEVTGLLMYYLAEHRGLRDPVVISVNNTSMAARLGEHYGIKVYETPVGFKYIGPKMIETGAMMGAEESGGFGFGMHLPERDGIYADLLLLDLFLREKAAGRWPVSKAIEHFHELAGPSFYRRIDVHVERDAVRRDQAPAARGPARAGRRPSSPAQPVDADRCRSTRTTASSSSSPTARGCSSGRRGTEPLVRVYTEATSPRPRDAMLAAGERLVRGLTDDAGADATRPRGRRVDKPWGHELIWAHTDRYVGKILVIETGQAAVAPAPRGQGRVDPRPVRPPAADLEDDDGDRPGRGARARRAPPRRRPAGSTATRRSSAAS